MPYIFTSQERVPAEASLPFNLEDPKIQSVLSKAVEEMGKNRKR